MKDIRCAGCGKIIEPNADTAKVETGRMQTESESTSGKVWGVFHMGCFERAVDSPTSALAEIRKLARQQTTVIQKPKRQRA